MKTLVTGAAGFIGFHLAKRLLQQGEQVFGLDNLNPYYDVTLKESRLALLQQYRQFQFQKSDLADRQAIADLFSVHRFDRVFHLAAQAGVRYSLDNPHCYVESNLVGFLNILEGCRASATPHLIYASSSSVYGSNKKMPFSVLDSVDHPISLYAATKKANELMAHSYAHLYHIPVTGLRFFTVYGPWGRPDMALFIFTKAILEGRPISVYNYGKMERDFTYIDDIIEGIMRVGEVIPKINPDWQGNDPSTSAAPYRIFNIGHRNPVPLLTMIEILEKYLEKEAIKNFLPIQPGDVPATYADMDALISTCNFLPKTSIEEGINRFVSWYRSYYLKPDP